MKLYSNAQLKGSYLGHLPQSVTRTRQYSGKSNWDNDLEFWGMMDDFRVYDRAITLSEVEQIYQGDLEQSITLGGEDPKVTLYWGDEDAGMVTKISQSENDGWDYSEVLDVLSQGQFSYTIGLTGEKFSSAAKMSSPAWSIATFSTGDFDFGSDS